MSLSPTAIASAFSASAFLVAWTVLVLDDSPTFTLFRGLEEVENGFGATAVIGLSEALGAIGKVVEGGWLASLWSSLDKKSRASGKRRKAPIQGKQGTRTKRCQVDLAEKGQEKGERKRERVGIDLRGPRRKKETQQDGQRILKLSGKGERRKRSSRAAAGELNVVVE